MEATITENDAMDEHADAVEAEPAATPVDPDALDTLALTSSPNELHEVRIHGHRVCFRLAGQGPLIVLVHGITGNSDQWEPVMEALATRSSRQTCSATVNPRNRAATTRSARTRRGSATS